ncbi:MAG: transporter [Opitutae bacterium]|nr:transporter [Opitutae bacterium]
MAIDRFTRPALRLALLRLGVLLLSACSSGVAAPGGTEAGGYSWTNPTPPARMRELNTDRPDATEGPFTVDPGHVQLEMDLANYTRDRADGVRTTETAFATTNLRFGLTPNFELGIFLSPYVRTNERPPGGPPTARAGIGDTTLRAKWNFHGNDGGERAFGLIVDVSLPTAARGLGNEHVEGAITLPIALALADGWEFGAMTGVGAVRSENTDGYRAAWTNSATLGHEIAGAWSGYVELFSETGEGAPSLTFNCGAVCLLDRDTQFDFGVNLGVSRAAPDAQVFAGLTRRF